MIEQCEWNRVLHCAALAVRRPNDCENPATVVLGADGQWHVCAECAKDAAFKRFTRRHVRGISGTESP